MLVKVTFIGGPEDGAEFEVAKSTLANAVEFGRPHGARHLYLLDESEWGYSYMYQGARCCAGK